MPSQQPLEKGHSICMGKEQKEAMDRLASAVAANPVLRRPDYDKPFHLDVDTSQFATGAILSQKNEQG
jgi:hypothetical protein